MCTNFVFDKPKPLRKQTVFSIAFILLLTTPIMTGLIAVNAATAIPTAAYVCAIPNLVGVGQTLVISGWVTPPPDINWNYAGYYFDMTNPDGTKTTKGPYNSFPDGTTYFTLNPTVLGKYSVILHWDGGNNTVNYAGQPTPPKNPYQPATSESFSFTVQQQQVQIGPQNAPLPTGYWSRPIASDLRSWSDLAGGGDWIYTGGFGDSWRSDGLGNNQVNPFSAGPNSAHIAWLKQSTPGGMAGGPSGPIADPTFPMINVIISGIGYYQLNGLHAVDIQTGEELWVNTASTANPTFGQPATTTYVPNVGTNLNPPYLWQVSDASIFQYNAQTGALVNTFPGTNRTTTISQADIFNPDGGVLLYLSSRPNAIAGTGSNLILWNSSKTGSTFAAKTVFTVPGIQVQTRPFTYLYNNVVITAMQGQAGLSNMSGYDSVTGQSLWNMSLPYEQEGNAAVGYGKLYMASGTDRKWHAYDVTTGQEVWASQPADFPFGAFWAYSTAVAYDKVYGESYDGHVYAFDANTGNLVWKFYSGNTTESPFNTWPFYARMVVADGKIYAGTTEHSPTPPYTTGNRIYCLDATTGKEIWSMDGQYQSKSIADGVLIAVDDYTGQMFAWGKGQTSTSLSLTATQVTKGQSVGITGMVLDQSPAQPGTAAVSKDSMTGQMEYLHMNRPAPTNTTGVLVTLVATAADGTTISIGQTTSNAQGHFTFQWTPPDAKLYTISATFAGDDSYWSSSAISDLNVVSSNVSPIPSTSPTPVPPTASPIVTPTPTTPQGPTGVPASTVYAIAAAVIVIVIVAVTAVALRKRK